MLISGQRERGRSGPQTHAACRHPWFLCGRPPSPPAHTPQLGSDGMYRIRHSLRGPRRRNRGSAQGAEVGTVGSRSPGRKAKAPRNLLLDRCVGGAASQRPRPHPSWSPAELWTALGSCWSPKLFPEGNCPKTSKTTMKYSYTFPQPRWAVIGLRPSEQDTDIRETLTLEEACTPVWRLPLAGRPGWLEPQCAERRNMHFGHIPWTDTDRAPTMCQEWCLGTQQRERH